MILFVDDDPFELELEKYLVQYYNIGYETASSGAEAIASATEKDYTVIVMDISMADINGFDAAAKIHDKKPDLPIIALSDKDISDKKLKTNGMVGALKKPLRLADLKEVLSAYFETEKKGAFPWRRKTDILFDYNELKNNLNNDEYAVMMVLDSFLNNHSGDCEKVKKYIADGNYEKAREVLGELYIIAGNIFCCRLYEQTYILYDELEFGQYKRLGVFEEVWVDTMGKIAEYELEFAGKFKRSQKETADWETVWSDFCVFCKNFDVETTLLFEKHISLFENNLKPDKYLKLKSYVTTFDYLNIIKMLEEADV